MAAEARARISDLSRTESLSRNAVSKHIEKAGIPKGDDGKYDVAVVRKAIRAHHATNSNQPSQAKEIKLRLECQKLKIANDQAQGLLIAKTEHIRIVHENNSRIAADMRNLARKLADHVPEDIRIEYLVAAEREVKECMRHIADELDAVDGPGNDEEKGPTA